jgi:outer membrane protein OmpA-like peptidoglycan-associated protein
MKRTPIVFVLMALLLGSRAQDFQGIQSSNYAGILGVYSNPANLADNRMTFDMTLIGLNFGVENNYVGVKRNSLKRAKDADGKTYFPAWDGDTRTAKENNLITADNSKYKNIYSGLRIMLPSFMVSLNHKTTIAFNWSLRNYVNVDGISPELAKLSYEELKYPSLWGLKLTNKDLNINQMMWGEYGFSLGQVLKEDNEHFFKAGATVKILQGLDAAYCRVKDLKFDFLNADSLSLFHSEVEYAHSDNLDPLLALKSPDPNDPNSPTYWQQIKQKYKFQSYPGLGFDFGMVYEFRPEYKKHKFDMDGEKDLWYRDHNKYKTKISFAINDIGGIRFNKGQLSNNFIADYDSLNLHFFDTTKNVLSYDNIINNLFVQQPTQKSFKMSLPTSINIGVDQHLWKTFYLNLTANICNLQNHTSTRVHDYTTISLAPRFDHKWFGLTLPLTYSSFAAKRGAPVVLGTMVRLGPLIVGTTNMPGLFFKDVYGANFYMALKMPFPAGHPRDRDKDGISDKKDLCKTVPGVWEFMGCPDKDGDHIQDKDDKCPEVPGIKELQGCPDKDGDGITDAEDACPDDKGPVEFKGCPDRDGDKIIDKDDECPDDAGLIEFMGCPDRDGDGTPDRFDNCIDVFGPKEYKGCPDRDGDSILDKEDACPDTFGPRENKGCPWPDTDKDGVYDKDDDCVTVPGLKELKGCPPPPPMKEKEKKILEKAFSSLEFATAKDIIKPKSFPSLNDLAKIMKDHKGDWKLKLSGHTDNQGDADKNMVLSEKRSKAVKAYLAKKGVPADNIIVEWFGSTVPIGDNSTPEGRQKNRRVEMKVIFKEQ